MKLRIAVRGRGVEHRTARHTALGEGREHVARRPRSPQVAVSHDDISGGELGDLRQRVFPRIRSHHAEMGKHLRERLPHLQPVDVVILNVKNRAQVTFKKSYSSEQKSITKNEVFIKPQGSKQKNVTEDVLKRVMLSLVF